MLAVRLHGSGPYVIALHGFTHTSAQFDVFAGELAHGIAALDLPGHGASVNASTDATSVIDAVAETITSLGGPAPVLGYSQGARVALAVALDRPEAVASLVLVSGTPGIPDRRERTRRRDADLALGRHIRTVGVPAFVDEWTSSGITSTTHRPADVRDADRDRRAVNTPDGLARALAGYGQGAMRDRWDQLSALRIPTLIVSGSRDEAYTEIGTAMAGLIEDAQIRVVADAGHDPIGDRPHEVAGLVSAFLDLPG